ncbi:MAG: DUF2769 domain-containing protein [Candidatus Bathyarchaeota archaeon]|nr:DUF2769 domain-containing protein [Candidatus Bathyarchaeota archaeon]
MGNPVLDNQENAALCICPSCPTYLKSKLTGTLFCARGKANQNASSVGCICATCPVYLNNSLSQLYYCMQGKSQDL